MLVAVLTSVGRHLLRGGVVKKLEFRIFEKKRDSAVGRIRQRGDRRKSCRRESSGVSRWCRGRVCLAGLGYVVGGRGVVAATQHSISRAQKFCIRCLGFVSTRSPLRHLQYWKQRKGTERETKKQHNGLCPPRLV